MILPVGTANHTQIGFVVGLADLLGLFAATHEAGVPLARMAPLIAVGWPVAQRIVAIRPSCVRAPTVPSESDLVEPCRELSGVPTPPTVAVVTVT